MVLGKPRPMRRMRAMKVALDGRIYMLTGELDRICKLHSYDLSGKEGFLELGVLAVDRSPYYAKRAYSFDAMAIGPDGSVFLGESDRRGQALHLHPGPRPLRGRAQPDEPRRRADAQGHTGPDPGGPVRPTQRSTAMNGRTLLAVASASMPALAAAADPPRDFSAYARPVPAHVMADLPFAMTAPVPPVFPDRVFGVADYGAVPDGVTLNTKAFAAAIAACVKAGGGHVVVPPGVWRTGPIELESGVDLHLDRGALVSFSRRFEDFPVVPRYPGSREYRVMSPITAHGKEGFAITGKGVFDGSGDAWAYAKKDKLAPSEWRRLVARGGALSPDGSQWWPSREALEGGALVAALRERKEPPTAADFAPAREYLRADMVNISNCRDVLIDGPTFRNSPHFTIHPVEVENLIIRDVAVRNPWNTQNADGIDIGPCRNVVVYDTLVDTGDDGICMKPGLPTVRKDWTVASENVVIADSTVFRAHGGFVIGSETSGGMRNVMVRNLTLVETDIGLRFKSARGRGGVVERIYVRDVAMKDIATGAVVFQTSYGGAAPAEEPEGGAPRPTSPVADGSPAPASRIPQFQDFFIENLACDGAREAMVIEGLPEAPSGGSHSGTSPSRPRAARGWSKPRGSGCPDSTSCRRADRCCRSRARGTSLSSRARSRPGPRRSFPSRTTRPRASG